ncbi:methylated-DNA--[protein]-cysteine S-methyltransferase [Clostridium tagluense]|uniref:methylated-DNA--[protein]-cysteine S-methyltransferase n=1 Tax=Clostridium tagluense TaxID=360422 RepID=UPI001CF31CCF|nr:methylated-DNA--[protein]-cysteine S-methyltransferase [Clostridium tagluense]MCB2313071.1 methylated-DNA--[protein]-cysteine S-methyltransferase [Clostridium tagluense]MCB2317820.1 methylated-DNA--[protein]-cysteine S-methyltransferase [Clostridium tagluense]MCB2322605.1 methylated-DNA--[protein]-cysteine S-methyltransferase [Clostridium tagluense]MCB2327620.1 methylated-DNA--[protein]-cysteine S-methyltransferase [Clostridium tagluense]MCB2332249.1 methylated-DNA--[protein]-cysteine S-met
MTKKYHGYYNSPIGVLEIITSDDAVISAMFVEEMKQSTEESEILRDVIQQFDEYFKGTRKKFYIKCEVQGTEFQKKVWDALTEIPYGVTLSYKELAIAIGNEKAARAVGKANSVNIISIIIPCHRVIGSDKSLTGYAGGINRKQWLLEHERENSKIQLGCRL